MQWSHHTNVVCKKAPIACKVLNFIGGICSIDSEVKSMNYFVFVHPIILMEQQQVYGTHINII